MPLKNRKWTDDQREAMGRGVVDDGLPAKEVAARAAAGTLLDNLEPFGPPPASTVRDAAAKYRQRLEGRARSPASKLEPAAALRTLFERVVSILEHGLEAQERNARVGKADPVKLGQFGKTLRDLIPVARELQTAAMAGPAKAAAIGAKDNRRRAPATLTDELLEGASREQRGGSPSIQYAHTHIGNADQDGPPNGDGDSPLAPTPRTTDNQNEEDGGPDCAEAADVGDGEGMAAAAALRARLGLTHA